MTGSRFGAVLAGGAGSRVGGADKGLLPLRGRPLIEHVLDALRPQCDEVLIVANRNRNAYARHATVISDELHGYAGPLAGIIAALMYANVNAIAPSDACEWLLTIPVDCPRPPRDLRERLQSALMKADNASCAFVHDGRGAQPLFALYRLAHVETLLTSARAALSSHASVLRWHEGTGACALDFSDQRAAFHNLNTPEEFLEYERAHDEP